MKRPLLTLLLLIAALPLVAQTDVNVTINPSTDVLRIVVPFPNLLKPAAVDAEEFRQLFFSPLTREIDDSDVFAIVSPPLGKLHLKLNVWLDDESYVIDARLVDAADLEKFNKRYRSRTGELSRTAHRLAYDLVKSVGGDPASTAPQIPDLPWYVRTMKRKIGGNFHRHEGVRDRDAVVSFRVRRDGTLTDVKTEVSSGNTIFDRNARVAVKSSAPFSPLPADYIGPHLTVRMTFQ